MVQVYSLGGSSAERGSVSSHSFSGCHSPGSKGLSWLWSRQIALSPQRIRVVSRVLR